MYLLKNREYFIVDGEVFQADVSFKECDDNKRKKGYYIITCKIEIIKNSKEVKRHYSSGEIDLLKECNEESESSLKEALLKKDSILKFTSEKAKYFEREDIAIKDDIRLNYNVNSIASKAENTISILNSLKDRFEEYDSGVKINKSNDKKNNSSKNDDDDYFKPKKHTGVKFDDIAGLKEVKEELVNVVDFIKNPEKYKAMDVEIEKGILLYGPPGTGKTLIAKALSTETKSNFFEVSGSEFVEKFVGIGAKRVRQLFKSARKNTPSIIFIDEIDAIGKKRGSGQGNNDERDQTINELLVQLDGFKNNEGVVVIAATNRIEMLDPALTRSGRFGEHIHIGNPDLESRKELFKIHTAKKPLNSDVDVIEFAKKTHGFNGADIKHICNTAGLLAIREDKDYIAIEHFEKAIDRTIVGLHSKTKKIIENERKIVAYHESGHAILNRLTDSKELRKISIVPTGTALGFVYNLPNEDRYLYSKTQLKNEIKVLLAGKVAEELTFGEATNGASNDLQKASNLALKMVREYGMDEDNGLFSVSEDNLISKEERSRAEQILKACYNECKDIIEKHKPLLEHIANELLEKEELNSDEFEDIIKMHPYFNDVC